LKIRNGAGVQKLKLFLNGLLRSPARTRDTTRGDATVTVHHRSPWSHVGTTLSLRAWLQWRSLFHSLLVLAVTLCSCLALRRSTLLIATEPAANLKHRPPLRAGLPSMRKVTSRSTQRGSTSTISAEKKSSPLTTLHRPPPAT
jgi:hypothetical protein